MAKKDRIALTDHILSELRGEIDRTLVGPHLLMKRCEGKVPEGLSRPTIENWLYERCKTARTAHIEFVLEQLRALPDGDRSAPLKKPHLKLRPGYVPITADMRETLKGYREQGLLPSKLFKHVEEIPSGLQPSTISTWINGSASTARKEFLDFVLEACSKVES